MEKPVPFWLNRDREWTDAMEPAHLDPINFTLKCVDTCLDLGMDIVHSIWVTGNACQETGHGRYHKGNNLGGVKIWKDTATPLSWWWMAPGHVDSGDPVWCYYRVFMGGFSEYFSYWYSRYVPKPGTALKSRYKKTGEEFHAYKPWFDDLIAAGYKGEVTKAHPEKSISAEENIENRIENIVAQRFLKKLGLYTGSIDANFGPKSKAALQHYQESQGLEKTERPELIDLWSMYHRDRPFPEVLKPKKEASTVVNQPEEPKPEEPKPAPPAPIVSETKPAPATTKKTAKPSS